MKDFKREFFIPLLLAIITIIALRIPSLNLPLCYAEAQLYAGSVFPLKSGDMFTILSDSGVELPDFFSVIISLFAGLVSPKAFYLHLFCTLFAALSVVAAYKFGKFFFSVQAGVISASLMIVQNVFLAQTGLSLPNMFQNCLIITGLYCYFREKFPLCALVLTLSALTSVLGFVTSGLLLAAYYKEKSNREWKLSTNILLCLPIAAWFAYQILSITICGKLSSLTFAFDVEKTLNDLSFIFVKQFRFIISLATILMVLIIKFSKDVAFYANDVFKTSILWFLLITITSTMFLNSESGLLPLVSVLSIFCGCALSILNINFHYKYLITTVLIAIFSLGAVFNNQYSDSYITMKDKVEVDKKTIEILLEKANTNQTIICDNSFKTFLEHPVTGYVSSSYDFIKNHKIILKEDSVNTNALKIITNFPISTPENNNGQKYKTICKILKNNYDAQILKPAE